MIQNLALTRLAGTAGGTVTHEQPVSGELVGLYVASNAPGTVIIAQASPPLTLLNLTGGAGSAWYYPRAQACNVGGTALSGWYTEELALDGYLTVGCNTGGTVQVTLALEK